MCAFFYKGHRACSQGPQAWGPGPLRTVNRAGRQNLRPPGPAPGAGGGFSHGRRAAGTRSRLQPGMKPKSQSVRRRWVALPRVAAWPARRARGRRIRSGRSLGSCKRGQGRAPGPPPPRAGRQFEGARPEPGPLRVAPAGLREHRQQRLRPSQLQGCSRARKRPPTSGD